MLVHDGTSWVVGVRKASSESRGRGRRRMRRTVEATRAAAQSHALGRRTRKTSLISHDALTEGGTSAGSARGMATAAATRTANGSQRKMLTIEADCLAPPAHGVMFS